MRRSLFFKFSPANAHFKSLSTHHLFDEIPHPHLNPISFILALKSSPSLHRAAPRLHALALSSGLFLLSSPLRNSLTNAYAKSGSFDLAFKLFTHLPNPDVVSWNTVLSAFESSPAALHFASRMHRSGVALDAVSFTMAVSFSADLQELCFGPQIHCLVFKSGFNADSFIGNSLITMYMRCGSAEDARKVFDEKPVRDLVSWNALISGLTQEGNYGNEAIEVFVAMTRDKESLIRPDHVSLASVISATGQEKKLEFGRQVHCFATKLGLESLVSVANVLMSMYYKCESTDSAESVFYGMRDRDVVSWTTMISMDETTAFHHFNRMRFNVVQPNNVTFVALIYAVTPGQSLEEAQMVHSVCFGTGYVSDINVSNSLISMYAKISHVEESRKVFDEMPVKEVISWNSLITGYAQNGLCEDALQAFSSSLAYCRPNQYTFGSVLSAITAAQTVSLTYGQRCHCRILKYGLSTNEYVSGVLVDMYAKHGSMDESQKAFDETTHRSLISWTAIISARAKHGDFHAVMALFEEMLESGVQPDHVTYLAVLMACGGGKGMADVGIRVFNAMVSEHGLDPWPEHYSCAVDMLGRAGRLAEADGLVKRMEKGSRLSALQSLLGACRVHGELEMGERVAEALMAMEPKESGTYVLISNLYADRGEWAKVARLRKLMRERGVKKEVGFSWVDAGSSGEVHMHKFSSDDRTHPLAEEIYGVVQCLALDIKVMEEEEDDGHYQ